MKLPRVLHRSYCLLSLAHLLQKDVPPHYHLWRVFICLFYTDRTQRMMRCAAVSFVGLIVLKSLLNAVRLIMGGTQEQQAYSLVSAPLTCRLMAEDIIPIALAVFQLRCLLRVIVG